MAYRIEYRATARRELARLPRRIRRRVRVAIDALRANPRPVRALWMWGDWEGYWRLTIGEYRAVYDIDDRAGRVVVVRVGHRGDVYRGRS